MRSSVMLQKIGQRRKTRALKDRSSRDACLEQLFEAGIALGEICDLRQLLERVCEIAVVMANCEGCSILSSDGDRLKFLASFNCATADGVGLTTFFTDQYLSKNSASIAGYCAVSKQVVSIRDVYDLPSDVPFSYDSSFDAKTGYRCKSVLAVPMLDSQKNLLGVLELINHINDDSVEPFPEMLYEYLRALATQVGIVLKNTQAAEELRQSRLETVLRFVRACEYRDPETGGHIDRIANYCALLYKKMGFSSEECEVMRLASMLHDVGKISIPDAILKKPGRLTPEERVVMQTHSEAGYEMLSDTESPMLQMGATIARAHHEKWDGTGYPLGLKGEEIPLEGRIVALADVFDALSSKRCYKDAWPLEKVLDTIKADSGTHFDPVVSQVFFENLEEILAIRQKYPVEAVEEQMPVQESGTKAA